MLKKSQQGISMIGLMLLAPIVGFLVLIVLKMTPVYIEHAALSSSLKNMSGERTESYATPMQVKTAFKKRLELQDVTSVGMDDIQVERQGSDYTISVDYEVREKLFYNLSMVATFSDQGEVPAN